MRNLYENAQRLVEQGTTTLDELLRVCGDSDLARSQQPPVTLHAFPADSAAIQPVASGVAGSA